MLSGWAKSLRYLIVIGFVMAVFTSAIGLVGDTLWVKRLTGEKFYEETELKVEARVLPDGSMLVKEIRTLDFAGEFTRYRRQVPHYRFGDMTEVSVAEPNLPYSRIQTASGRPERNFLFYKTKASGSEQYVIELFFHAKDTRKTFIIEYRITDAIELHKDVAELDWKFIGAGRSVDIGKMSVDLLLPSGARPDEVKVWGHGPLKGEVKKVSESQLFWRTDDLPKNRFLEGRAVFPLRLIPQGRNFTNKTALPGILAQEQKWAEERAKEQRNAQLTMAGSGLIAVLGLGLSWWIYRRFGRKYQDGPEVDYYRELPGPYSPAETGCLLAQGAVRPVTVAATFMDLARRGYMRLEPANNLAKEDILVRQLKPIGEELAIHERLLLDFFFNRVGGMQPVVWFSSLKTYQQNDKAGMKDFVDSFQAAVKQSVDAMGFIEAGNQAKTYSNWGCLVSMVAAVGCYFKAWFFPMTAFVIALIGFLAARTSSRDYTRAGQQQVDLWEAFRRFLKDFSNLDQARLPQLILWEHFLVYAVVLGVAKEVIKQLPIVYPQVANPDSQFGYYWGGMYHTHYGPDGMAQPSTFAGLASFADMTDSLVDTWSQAYSSASIDGSGGSTGSSGGDGGGFSGGGGDGGGGGGGDAD